jgi:hypothetical protein
VTTDNETGFNIKEIRGILKKKSSRASTVNYGYRYVREIHSLGVANSNMSRLHLYNLSICVKILMNHLLIYIRLPESINSLDMRERLVY